MAGIELAIRQDKRSDLHCSVLGVASKPPAFPTAPVVSFEAAQSPEPMQVAGIWISFFGTGYACTAAVQAILLPSVR